MFARHVETARRELRWRKSELEVSCRDDTKGEGRELQTERTDHVRPEVKENRLQKYRSKCGRSILRGAV